MDRKSLLTIVFLISTYSLCISQTISEEANHAKFTALLREKAIKTMVDLSRKINLITNSKSSKEDVNSAIDQACKLFISENAMVESPAFDSDKQLAMKIRSYLNELKLHTRFDKIIVECGAITVDADFKKAKDGSYYGFATFVQKIEGFNNNKSIYKESTKNRTKLIFKSYTEISKDKISKTNWRSFLSDIVSLNKELIKPSGPSKTAVQVSTDKTVKPPKVKSKPDPKPVHDTAKVILTKQLSAKINDTPKIQKPLPPRFTDDQFKEKFEGIIKGESVASIQNYFCSNYLNIPVMASDVSDKDKTINYQETLQQFCSRIHNDEHKYKIHFVRTEREYPDCVVKFQIVYEQRKKSKFLVKNYFKLWLTMKPYLKNEATILLTPTGGWNWFGWTGRLTVHSLQKPLQLSGGNIIIESDVPMFTLLVPRQYNTISYPIPGIIVSSLFAVDKPTLSDIITVNDNYPLLLSTTGTFTCDVAMPASRPTINAPLDMVIQKSGTWKVVDANQRVFFRSNAKEKKIKDAFPGRQNHGNCGIQSSVYLMQLVSCPGDIAPKELNEENIMYDSIKRGFAGANGGTNPGKREQIMEGKGIKTTQVPYSQEALENVLKENKPAIVAVNPKFLTPAIDDNGEAIPTGWENYNGAEGHAITAVDAKYDNTGKMTQVLVGDTGTGEQYWLNPSVLNKAVMEHPNNSFLRNVSQFSSNDYKLGNMNVSKSPIKTDCKK